MKKQLYEDDDIVGSAIAIKLRTLLYDGKHGRSLLKLLDLKNGYFLSTNTVDIDADKNIHLGLVRGIKVGVIDGKGGEVKYWPLYNDRYFKFDINKRNLSFENWWNEIIMKNENFELSRKTLILNFANKDGGAHYDEKVDAEYDEFRQTSVNNDYLVGIYSEVVRGYDNAPAVPALKQIAFEIIETFKQITL